MNSAAATWDAAAQGWHDSGPQVRAWLHDATAALLDAAGIEAGMQVLDVAAGAGDQTLDIARRVGARGRVLATDVSPRLVTLGAAALRGAGFHNVEWRVVDAQTLGLAGAGFDAAVCRLGLMFCPQPALALRGAGLHNVEWRVVDAQTLGLAGAGFDAAVCRLGLMFCPQPALALRALHDALRPGARAAVLVFGIPEGNPCITALARIAQRHAGAPPGDPFAPGTLLSLGRPGLLAQGLADSGFSDVRIDTIEAPFLMPSVHHYIDFLRSAAAPVIAQWQALPSGVRAAAWEALTLELSAFNGPQGWQGPNRLLLASARVDKPTHNPRTPA